MFHAVLTTFFRLGKCNGASCYVTPAEKIREMDDLVWENADSQLNLTAILQPIFNQVRYTSILKRVDWLHCEAMWSRSVLDAGP